MPQAMGPTMRRIGNLNHKNPKLSGCETVWRKLHVGQSAYHFAGRGGGGGGGGGFGRNQTSETLKDASRNASQAPPPQAPPTQALFSEHQTFMRTINARSLSAAHDPLPPLLVSSFSLSLSVSLSLSMYIHPDPSLSTHGGMWCLWGGWSSIYVSTCVRA
jgi:hypothetical protein